MATVKKGKPELRKKVMPAVVVRQSKPWRRADGVYLYFEDNAGVLRRSGTEEEMCVCMEYWQHSSDYTRDRVEIQVEQWAQSGYGQEITWDESPLWYIMLTGMFAQIVNPKGEMIGSAITGPVGKEAAELWPRIASNSGVVM
ncbi:MAG: hypothetical protein Q9169_008178 [Polycauliona sp. 2 TL-2023]